MIRSAGITGFAAIRATAALLWLSPALAAEQTFNRRLKASSSSRHAVIRSAGITGFAAIRATAALLWLSPALAAEQTFNRDG